MPELPEVETVMRGLTPVMLNNVIEHVQLNRKDLRIPFTPQMNKKLQGVNIHSLSRRAKYILVNCSAGKILVIHLGMSGRISIVPAEEEYIAEKHDHMVLTLKTGDRIIYNDPRRFGMVFVVNDKDVEAHKCFAHLGPEPLGNDFYAEYLKSVLKNKKTSIKQAVLDQRVVVGVGNIYACEALYQAGIRPTKLAGKVSLQKLENLVVAIKDVLARAILAGGSTLKDYRHADGELGYFQHNFTTYDCEGQSCQSCGATIKRIVQGGRSTFYCPKCQK